MKFINYSQNFEDIYIWRALKKVKKGFYIDVGANDPISDSITKSFYDRGWRGINIEPVEAHLRALEQDRPEDINLGVAVGNKTGFITLYDTDIRGWATTSDEIAETLRVAGHPVEEKKVELSTLELVCSKHILEGQDIHFLKIDVEGFEKDVLEGADFKKYRPWIILVEATLPNTQILNFDIWENILLSNNYIFSFFDGVNRYYISTEKFDELYKAFEMPITVFDDYVPWRELQLQQNLDNINITIEAIKSNNSMLKSENEVLKQEYVDLTIKTTVLENELNGIYNSLSWRLTKPLRWANYRLKYKKTNPAQNSLFARIYNWFGDKTKKLIAKLFFEMKMRVLANRKLKGFICKLLKSTGLFNVFKQLYLKINNSSVYQALYGQDVSSTTLTSEALSPYQNEILALLKKNNTNNKVDF